MKLTNVAGRKGLAALVTVVSLAMASQAWGQTSECPDARITGRLRTAVVPSTLLGVIENESSSVDALQGVMRDCQQILEASQRGSVDALLCVSRAQIKLGDRDVDAATNYGYARCHAYRASRLSSAARSRANAMRADALVGLIRVNSGSADAYGRELLGDDVHDRSSSAAVHRAVSRIYIGRNNSAGALSEARTHLQGAERAIALIDISNMVGGDRRLLEEARTADPTSIAVNSALGAAYFESNRNEARGFLWAATQGGVPQSTTEQELQRNAYYYRSIIEADERNYAEAIRHADQAGNSPQAMRQQCLARLAAGGEQVHTVTRDSHGVVIDVNPARDGQRSCELLRGRPEGPLLEGMFWLRYAQQAPEYPGNQFNSGTEAGNRRWLASVDRARQSFLEGSNLVNDNRALDWPGVGAIAGSSNPVTLRTMYRFAADNLSVFFISRCEGALNTPPQNSGAENVFIYYKIVGPRNVARRCRRPEAN